MAPRNKVTKSESNKTPTKSSAANPSPSKGKTPKAAATPSTDFTVRMLWLALKGLLDEGAKIDYPSVANGMGLTLGATKKRFERLRKALDNADSINETAQQGSADDEAMNEANDESGEASTEDA